MHAQHAATFARAAAGAFIKTWVPELGRLEPQWVHEPWLAPKRALDAAGVHLGCEYPAPILTIEESRAALAHAYGVVLKCQAQRRAGDEPYRLPSVPVQARAPSVYAI